MLSKSKQRQYIKELSARFNVLIVITKLKDCRGQTYPHTGLIELDVTATVSESCFVSTIMHEIAHVWGFRNNKFKVYHSVIYLEDASIRELKTYLQTAWRAERWTEMQARKWLNQLYPSLTYWFSYGRLKGRERNKEWMDTEELKDVREIYRRKKLEAIDIAKGQ